MNILASPGKKVVKFNEGKIFGIGALNCPLFEETAA